MEIKSIESAKINDNRPTVVVTGVTGQDGSHMVDYLLKKTDYIVYGAARRLSVANHSNIKHINDGRFVLFNMDVTDPHSIGKTISTLKPKYFINFAAQSFVGSSWDFPEQTWQTNCTAVLHMLEAIRQYHPTCRFYNAGSSEEMGDVIVSPQDETHPARPRSPYGASKVAARQLVKVYRESYHLYAVQGWLFNHEGTRRGEEFVTRKITKSVVRIFNDLKKERFIVPLLLGNVDSERDWGDSEDFVDAVWRMLNQEEYNSNFPTGNIMLPGASQSRIVSNIKDYVVGTGEVHSIKEFVEEAFKNVGIYGQWEMTDRAGGELAQFIGRVISSPIILAKTSPEFYRPADVNNLVANYSAIKNDLGWAPTTTFKELIKKMVSNDLKA